MGRCDVKELSEAVRRNPTLQARLQLGGSGPSQFVTPGCMHLLSGALSTRVVVETQSAAEASALGCVSMDHAPDYAFSALVWCRLQAISGLGISKRFRPVFRNSVCIGCDPLLDGREDLTRVRGRFRAPRRSR